MGLHYQIQRSQSNVFHFEKKNKNDKHPVDKPNSMMIEKKKTFEKNQQLTVGRVVASSSTTFSLCISSRASQSFTRPFNPNNRPQPKDGGGIKNKIYTLHTYVRTRLNGLYMKKKKNTTLF